MEDPSGARRQAAMQHPEVSEESEWRMFYPVRAVIEGVRYADQTPMKRTVVDCYVLDRTGRRTERGILYNVPLGYGKINTKNGDEESPEKGDLVLIQFINGNLRDPVVTFWIGPPDNEIQATADQHPRSYRKHQDTSEEIDKDGNRTTIVKGHETEEVQTGDFVLTVTLGKQTVTVQGKIRHNGKGTIEFDGTPEAAGTMGGVLQEQHICQFHGNPFSARGDGGTHFSTTVKASKE